MVRILAWLLVVSSVAGASAPVAAGAPARAPAAPTVPGGASASVPPLPTAEEDAQLAAPVAPPSRAWSLGQVLEQAVQHSPTLASARIDVEVAEAAVLEAIGAEDWLFSATGSYLRQRSKASSTNIIGTDSVDQIGADATLSKLLFTGGTLSVTASGQRSETAYVLAMGEKSVQDTASVTARLDQPLLRGFGPTATYGLRDQARFARTAARLAKEATARTLVRDLVAAYWEVAYAAADLNIRIGSLTLARERRRLTESAVRLGSTAPTEVVAVDQVIAQREEEVVQSQLALQQRSIELRRLAGLEIGPRDIEIAVTAPLEVSPRPVNVDQVVEAALAGSPEIAALQARGKGATIAVEVSENGLLPRLDLSVYGGPLGSASNMSDAVDQVARGDGYQVGGQLALQHPFGRSAGHGAELRARAERQRIQVNLADVHAQIAEAAVESVALARSSATRMALSRTAIDLSERNIKAEVGRFELGKSTNFDVLLRQDELKQARLRYARAVVDYLKATAFIGALTGEILPEYGIKVD